MGCKILRIIPNERPDAMVVIEEAEGKKTIGIEHTEFHVDAQPKKSSPGRDIHLFWSHVQKSIHRRVSHRRTIQYITGLVSLHVNTLHNHVVSIPRKNKAIAIEILARNLAEELVKLAIEFPIAANANQTISRFSCEYPLLKSYVKKVWLMGTGAARCVSWECSNSNVSSIGVSAEEIALIIQNKDRELAKYCRDNVKERWLLITASGRTVFNSADPHPEFVDWTSDILKSILRSVHVDRIFFWDRMFNWYKEVWPGAPAVQREWRASKLC